VSYLALSVKQPWAALLVSGLKSVEVRSWTTGVRGPLLIHAARVPDSRPEGWAALPAHLAPLARLVGGIVGVGTLTECKPYPDPAAFLLDQARHWNAPEWYDPRGLFGWCFTQLRPLPFLRLPGNVRLFRVEQTAEQLGLAAPVEPASVTRRRRQLIQSLGLSND
jgi:hypothetical protein